MDIQRKTISDPAFKKAFAELRLPERTRTMVAYSTWMALTGGRAMPMEEAGFLARQWAAILEQLQARACLPRGVPGTHSLPWRPELRRCPFEDTHRFYGAKPWTHPDKPVATAPVLGNQFKGDYSCPHCGSGRSYIDLVGLLDKDWDAEYQQQDADDGLLAKPVAATGEAQR